MVVAPDGILALALISDPLSLLENPPKASAALLAAARQSRPACLNMRGWREEAIARRHDRKSFDCGSPELKEYLEPYARQNQ